MNSTTFLLKYPEDTPERIRNTNHTFTIPLLPAYAIEYTEFYAPNQLQRDQKSFFEGADYIIQNDKLIWKSFEEPLFIAKPVYRLIVHYHGIRDYSLLFPHVDDNILRKRLGRFYMEAEMAFENKAWLSFALMCGALYEGLLFVCFKKPRKSYSEMIEGAAMCCVIDRFEYDIMCQNRELRNLVHGGNYGKAYVSRLQAMDMRKVMDTMVKKDWGRHINK